VLLVIYYDATASRPENRLRIPPKLLAGLLALLLPAAASCRRAVPGGPAAAPPPTIAAAPPAPPAPPPRGKQITIVYSSNLLGEYEPCG